MVLDIAAEYGVEVLDVLTGFKFIGEKITEFEASGEKEFILGFEESLGYLIGKHARDKDAAVAAGLAAIMALKYKEEGTNLLERLAELREEFGYYLEDLESIRLEGKEGQEVITKTIARLREESPEKIAGRRVKVVKDYKLSTINYLDENQEEEIKLPKSNVLQYLLEGDAKLTIRPSGTEPKLKFYFAVREKDQVTAEKVLAGFKENLMSEVEEIMNSF